MNLTMYNDNNKSYSTYHNVYLGSNTRRQRCGRKAWQCERKLLVRPSYIHAAIIITKCIDIFVKTLSSCLLLGNQIDLTNDIFFKSHLKYQNMYQGLGYGIMEWQYE